MIWHRGDNHVFVINQISPDHEAGLVVQYILPPVLSDELRNQNGDVIGLSRFPLYCINEFLQRPHNATVSRFDHDQTNTWIPFFPLLLHLAYRLIIEANVQRDHMIRHRLGVTDRIHNDPGNARNRNDYRIAFLAGLST